MNIILGLLVVVLLIVASIGSFIYASGLIRSVGSVARTSEYRSLTTIATTVPAYLIKYGQGTLGSVIIHNIGTGYYTLYDASTTIPSNRTIQATSSLRIVGIVANSQAVGTYTYDTTFNNGLIAVYGGTQGTSTITYR